MLRAVASSVWQQRQEKKESKILSTCEPAVHCCCCCCCCCCGCRYRVRRYSCPQDPQTTKHSTRNVQRRHHDRCHHNHHHHHHRHHHYSQCYLWRHYRRPPAARRQPTPKLAFARPRSTPQAMVHTASDPQTVYPAPSPLPPHALPNTLRHRGLTSRLTAPQDNQNLVPGTH